MSGDKATGGIVTEHSGIGTPLHLAVALDGAGWHPAAWRAADARPGDLFTPGYWAELVAEAERGLVDFVTLEDALGLQSAAFHRTDDRTDQVRGGLDAVLLAARLAPLTTHIGLVPTTNVTHTEPFHLAIGIATLDHASRGRAGWRPQISARAADATHFGRRTTPQLTDDDVRDPELIAARLRPLFAEAADVVEVARRLWDSWQDDAEIRDAATGRFIDRDKLHPIDFEGPHFSVRGPSITPRPPQGQPLVASLAHASVPYEFAARASDVVFVTRTTARAPGRSSRRSTRPWRVPAGTCGTGPSRGSPISSSSWTPSRAPPPGARPAWTPWPARSSPRTPRSSRAPPATSQTCCSTGAPPGSTASGCVRARCRTTSPRSPVAWSPSCTDAGPSAPPTRP